MADSFVLTERPWIPCERMDGTMVELSTHDALVEAPSLRGIVDPSPLVVAVLHRHLLAIVHRVVSGPHDFEAWAAVVRAGRFEPVSVARYLEGVRDRMDLFHPDRPFAQVRGLVEQFPDYLDPIDQMGVERSSWGGARALFQHRPVGYRAIMSPAEAARALLVHHAFGTGGLVKKPNEPTSATAAPLVRSGVILLKGSSLFQTLVANLLPYDPTLEQPIAGTKDDAPAWEQAPLPRELRRSDEPKRVPLGWLDLLTWVSRRIELVREGDAVVSYVRAVGQGLAEGSPNDPMVSYRLDEKRGFVAVGVDLERAFWRDASALFECARSRSGKYMRPRTLDHIASLEAQEVIGSQTAYQIELTGIVADRSRVDAIRVERVWARARYLDDADVRDAVTRMLTASNDGAAMLRSSLWTYARHMLSEGARDPATADIAKLVESLQSEPAFWAALGIEFDRALRAFDDGVDVAVQHFVAQVVHHARQALRRATESADDTSRSLKARALAQRALELGLAPMRRAVTPHEESPEVPRV
ncbi:MAG: type I-E CRISPR-associated protein Cse1/CasA [Sandaracinaceae bacterium]